MNYTITINQFAGEKYFPDLDIIDLAIFDYLQKFYPSADKFNDIHGIWFWVSHKKIIEDMPKLKINSKAGIIRRINNLVDCDILERHPESQQLSKSYYRIGENWNLLIKIDTSQSKSTGGINENQEPPLDENQDNPNTNINPNTNDPINGDWKNDFNIYLFQLRETYKELLKDEKWLGTQRKFHPNLDIKLTLEKACVNYWSTKEAWEYKKRKKSKTINWRLTLTNSLDTAGNKVYLLKESQKPIENYPQYQDLTNYKLNDRS